jgi:outer membrane receptor protein involved in Fe transport
VDETIGLTFSEPIFAVFQSGVFVLPNGQVNQLSLPASLGALGITLDPNRREYRQQQGRKIDLSAFLDATYDFTDKLTVNGGVRYVRNDRHFTSYQPAVGQAGLIRLGVYNSVSAAITTNLKKIDPTFSPTNPANPLFATYNASLGAALPGAFAAAPKNLLFAATNGVLSSDASFDGYLPRASVRYQFTDNLNGYAGVAKGQRSGFLDAAGNGTISPISPEKLWNYEVGLKGQYANFRFDGAVFKYDWTEFQTVELIDPANPSLGTRSVNAGAASAIGAEIATVLDVAEGVNLFTNLSYLDASFDKFKSSEGDYSGNRFRISPEWQGSIGINFERPLTANLTGFASARARYQSKVFFDNSNKAPKVDGAHTIASLNFGVRDDRMGWSARLFADNLFDEKYLIDAGNSGDRFGTPTAIAAAPLTYGVEVGMHF